MTQEPISAANEKLVDVYKFLKRNTTIFTIFAIFGALAGFLYSFNKPNDENLVFGILFLVSLMGLLMTLIFYDAIVTFFSLIRQEDINFINTFQIYFFAMFMILFLMFFISLIAYLYSNYSDWIIWLILAFFFYFILIFGTWFNTFIRNKMATSDRGLISVIFWYGIILFLLLTWLYFLFISPHSLNLAEFTHKAQIGFFLIILFTQSLSSIFYFIGLLIKSTINKKTKS